MSNRLTFSLASLIVLLTFAVMPAMAHDTVPDDPTTPATLGDQHGTGNTVPTGHTHATAPTVEDIELVDIMVGGESTARGGSVVLVDDADGATPAIADGETAAGQFVVKITFSEDVYDGTLEAIPTAGAPGTAATDAAADDLEASELTVNASEPSAAVELFGSGSITIAALQHQVTGQTVPTIATAIDADTADLSVFYVTFEVAAGLFGTEPDGTPDTADLPINIWITVNKNAVFTRTGLVSGSTVYGQGNTASTRKMFTIVGATTDLPSANRPPTVTTDPMTAPTAAVDSPYTFTYTTADMDNDTVTVEVSHEVTVVPSSAASHYTVDSDTDGSVTVTQAMPSATTMTIPAAYVDVTLTPNDGTVDGEAVEFRVEFAEATYDPPNQLPTVTTDPMTGPTDAVTGNSHTFMYEGADADTGDTATVAVTHAVSPPGAASHYEVDSTTTAGSVVVTQAMADATTTTVPAATVTVTLTPNDGTDDGTPVMYAVSFTEKTYQPVTDTIAAGKYQIIVGPNFDWETLPALSDDVTTQTVEDFPPDLAEYLVEGGTINVEATGGDVIINEFMVAIDTHKISGGNEADGQWIELWNKHASAAATGISVTFNQEKPANSPSGYADRFTNVAGQGWAFIAKFGEAVLNGSTNPEGRKNFVSIRRTDAGKDGSDQAAWGTAVGSLLFATGRVGTPGSKNTVDVFTPVPNDRPKLTGTVIISEVANRKDDTTEWIELKGPPDTNLKNWRLNKVTAVGTEEKVFHFPNNNNFIIPASGYLLLTDVDPLNSELAADYANGVPAPKRYKVVELGALPDGNFLLVLRNANNKDKTHEAIQDIAGYAGAAVQRANPYTTLWPLRGNAGHISNLNNFAEGAVYYRDREDLHGYARQHNDANKPAFKKVGFTGLGYDRNADVIAENGGTPGYAHGNYKHNGDDAAGNVVISEVMYGTGNGGPARNRNLSQWIEIHNMSDVNSVRLDDWRLEIVNSGYADSTRTTLYDGKLTDSVNLSGTLPPNQTYLIVARRLGVSQETHLPLERIRNAGKKFGEELLNPNGFYLTLKANVDRPAGEHKVIDTVGNLAVTPEDRRADSRSYSPHDWELSDLGHAINEDGTRISISRRHGAWSAPNTIATGTDMKGWILTSEDPRYSGIQQLTWYGRSDDHATPGYTIGAPLPVQLSTFRPTRLDDGSVVIRWATESELNNAGFNILRSETRDGQFTKLNTQLIAGQGTTSERTAYEWKDTTAKPNVVYYYQIQDVSIDGDIATLRTNRLRGHVSPTGKATTTWGKLKSLQ